MTSTTVAVAYVLANSPTTPVVIADGALAIQNSLDALQALIARDGANISSIALSFDQNNPIPAIALSADQLTKDASVLHLIADSPYTLTIDGTPANITANNSFGHGAAVTFSGKAAQYAIQSPGDGQSFTLTNIGAGPASVDHFSNVGELRFSDATYIVASDNFIGTTSLVSGVEVVSLYAATLGRTPDMAGLAYYESLAARNVPMGLINEYFLVSPEYRNNPAHSYTQTAAGEAQFITDTYHNVLHRDPEATAVPFYQHVVGQFTDGLTPGTADYAAADLKGHALVLVYFALSLEYRQNVQITAQHPADAQHFLYVI